MKTKFNYIITGGDLNKINEKYYLNSVSNVGFSMSGLMNTIRPKTEEELLDIITEDVVLRLGKQLYDAASKEQFKTTVEECINYQYSLLVVNSFRGFKMEKEAIKIFNEKGIKTKEVTAEQDNMYAVDLVIKHKDKIYGIQVKPDSYMNQSDKVKNINKKKNNLFNEKYNSRVLYLYYNRNGFSNMAAILGFLGFEIE